MDLDSLGNPLREYAYYPGMDRPHSLRKADGEVYYYLMDDPGNVAGLVDASNKAVALYRYRPHGTWEVGFDSISNPLRHLGAPNTLGGFTYLRARWYDPSLERFLSEDPIGLAGGINPYAFIGNAPMDGRDPSGLDHCGALQDAVGGGSTGDHACGGAGIALPGITATASWPFSTSRSSGFSSNFGNRGYTGSAFSGSGGGGGGAGGTGGFTPTENNPAPGVFLEGYSDAIESPPEYADPVALATGAAGARLGAKTAGARLFSSSGPLFRPGGLLNRAIATCGSGLDDSEVNPDPARV